MYTKKELIEYGFAPTPSRALMSIPFMIPICCTKHDYQNLPADIKAKYEPIAEGPVHHKIKG